MSICSLLFELLSSRGEYAGGGVSARGGDGPKGLGENGPVELKVELAGDEGQFRLFVPAED